MKTFHVTKYLCYLGWGEEGVFTEGIQMSQIFRRQNGWLHTQDKVIFLNIKTVENTIKYLQVSSNSCVKVTIVVTA